MNKVVYLLAAFALLSGCSTSDEATGQVGPSAVAQWTQDEYAFLGEIAKADLAASEYFSEDAYVQLGHFTCDQLAAQKSAEEVLAQVVAVADQNSVEKTGQVWFASTVMAAGITYLCPSQQFTSIQ